ISWLNVVEFSRVSDPSQRRMADSLVTALASNLFWLNPDFFKVAESEALFMPHTPLYPTHSDIEMAEYFVANALDRSKSTTVLGPQNLFSTVLEAIEIPSRCDALANQIVGHLELLRREFEANKSTRSAFNSYPSAATLPRGTRLIAKELI